MSPAEVLAFEARWRTRAAIGSAVGALLVLGGGIGLVTTLSSSKTDELTSQLLFYDHHSSSLLLATIVAGLGSVCMIAPLVYLFRATKARRPQLPNVALIAAWFGPIAAGLGQIALQVVLLSKAHTFVTSGAQTYTEAKHLTDAGILKGMQGLVLAGQLSLGFAFVLISLNAMRVGLLTRFMGVLGIIVGVLFVIPLGTLQVVQPFWLLTLTALFLGRWPNGVPPAWKTGKAEPWPTQQEMREEREKTKAARAKATGNGDAEPEPEPEPAAAVASSGARHSSSKKRKRKRRR